MPTTMPSDPRRRISTTFATRLLIDQEAVYAPSALIETQDSHQSEPVPSCGHGTRGFGDRERRRSGPARGDRQGRNHSHKHVQRARIVLLSAERLAVAEVAGAPASAGRRVSRSGRSQPNSEAAVNDDNPSQARCDHDRPRTVETGPEARRKPQIAAANGLLGRPGCRRLASSGERTNDRPFRSRHLGNPGQVTSEWQQTRGDTL